MSVKSKKEKLVQSGIKPLITVDTDLFPSELEGHHFTLSNTEAVRKMLNRVGLPKHLTDKGYSVQKH